MSAHVHNPALPMPADVIPHRPPHLWLDGITEAEAGVRAMGFWTPSDEHFAGHFDGMPLLPGVKQIEAGAQLGAYALMLEDPGQTLGIFKGIKGADFMRPVFLGETVSIRAEITDRHKRDFTGVIVIAVGAEETARAAILGSLLPKKLAERMLRPR